MLDTADDVGREPGLPASAPRIFLTGPPPGATRLSGGLHGGWWPRSWDPMAELPGLVLVLAARYGPIRAMNLSRHTWGRPFGRLILDVGLVDIKWPGDLGPAQLTAQRDSGRGSEPFDLLVVPPATPDSAAKQAMRAAADPANELTAPEILAATPCLEQLPDRSCQADGSPGLSSRR